MTQLISKIRLFFTDYDAGKIPQKMARWSIFLFLFITAIALYFPALGTGKFVYGTDTVSHDYILHLYNWATETADYRQIPLWNPYIFSGTPMLGSAALCPFYPSQWLYIFLPFNTAFTLQYVFALFVGGTGCYYWMRTLGIRHLLSVWAGLLFMFSGHFLTLTYAGHLQKMIALAWTPVALGATASIVTGGVLRLKNSKLIRSGLLLGFALGMQLLASHPQIFYGTAAICFLHLFGVAFSTIPWKQLAPGAEGILLGELAKKVRPAYTALVIAFGALVTCSLVSAVQLFPIMEISKVSNRANGVTFEEAVLTSYPPAELLEYGISRVFGDSVLDTTTPYTGKWGERVVSDYLGIPVLLMALIGFFSTRRRYRWFLLVMVVSGVLLGLGRYTPIYRIAYSVLPGFDGFRSPGTFMFLTTFGIIGLATIGFDNLVSYAKSLRNEKWHSGLSSDKVSSTVLSDTPQSPLALSPAPLEDPASEDEDEESTVPRTNAPHLYAQSGTTKATPMIIETAESKPLLNRGGFLILLVVGAILFAVIAIVAIGNNWGFQVNIATPTEKQMYHLYAGAASASLAVSLLLLSVFFLRTQYKVGAGMLALSSLVFPLFHNAHFLHFEPLGPYKSHLQTQPTLKALAKKAPQPVRIADANELAINQMLHQVGTAYGYHPVILGTYDTLARNLNPKSDAFSALFGINYARTVRRNTIDGNWEQDSEYRRLGSNEYLWTRKNPTPYIRNQAIVHPVAGTNDEVTTVAIRELTAMVNDNLSPASPHNSQPYNHAFVSERLLNRHRISPGVQNAQLTIQRWLPHKIMFRSSADTSVPGRRYLVPLSEPFAEGWKAVTAEGRNVPVISVNGGQRALVVPPGETTIRMRYEPFGFKLGLFATLSALVFLATAGMESLTRRGLKNQKKLRKFIRKMKGLPSETGAMPSLDPKSKI